MILTASIHCKKTFTQLFVALQFILIILLFNSCYSYKVYPKEYRKIQNKESKETVYILNDSLKQEFKILKKSNLFTFTTDSTQTDLKIKLYPIKQYPSCGNPLIAQVITLGQLPVYLPNNYEYQFDRVKKGKITSQTFSLQVTQRYWFWDLFTFNKNFERKAGQVLSAKYQEEKK
ncbi:hypothetical protein [Flavobacterium panacagri]|uniref:hypothetical protein n=1 Tax=Flavobacterium panacagri TaxID=3034146 RepID=UPI0025A59F5B|nr:hypothetical protein [Flavobacterium panacagri]